MEKKSQWIAVAGLLAIMGVAVYMVVQLNAQTPNVSGDFSNASVAEVRDAQARVVLRGNFAATETEDDDGEIEKKATLEPTDVDADAAGEAEVEFTKDNSSPQEIEFSIRNVQPGTTLTFVIDGRDVGTATADTRGRAELEIEVKAGAPGQS